MMRRWYVAGLTFALVMGAALGLPAMAVADGGGLLGTATGTVQGVTKPVAGTVDTVATPVGETLSPSSAPSPAHLIMRFRAALLSSGLRNLSIEMY